MTSNDNIQPHEGTSKAHLQQKISTLKGKIVFFCSKATVKKLFRNSNAVSCCKFLIGFSIVGSSKAKFDLNSTELDSAQPQLVLLQKLLWHSIQVPSSVVD